MKFLGLLAVLMLAVFMAPTPPADAAVYVNEGACVGYFDRVIHLTALSPNFNETSSNFGRNAVIGHDGVNTIRVIGKGDCVDAMGGDDVITAGAYATQSCTGGGRRGPQICRTIIVAGESPLHGGDDNDTITGADGGFNLLYGDAGDDTLIGANSWDQLFGGDGVDTLDGKGSNDNCTDGEILISCETVL